MMKKAAAAQDSPPTARTLWLRAAFGAPAALVIFAALLTASLGDGSLTSRLGSSVRGLVLAPFAGLLYGAILATVDLGLALVRVRRLPVGGMAWLSGFIATIVGCVLSALVALALKGNVADETFAGVVLAFVFAGAVGARLLLGKKPEPAAKRLSA
jgi:hypothetical protein